MTKNYPGKEMHITDALSRAAVENGTHKDINNKLTGHVNTMYEYIEKVDQIIV